MNFESLIDSPLGSEVIAAAFAYLGFHALIIFRSYVKPKLVRAGVYEQLKTAADVVYREHVRGKKATNGGTLTHEEGEGFARLAVSIAENYYGKRGKLARAVGGQDALRRMLEEAVMSLKAQGRAGRSEVLYAKVGNMTLPIKPVLHTDAERGALRDPP